MKFRTSIVFLSLLIIFPLFFAGNRQSNAGSVGSIGFSSSSLEDFSHWKQQTLDEINGIRTGSGLEPLALNQKLLISSQDKASQMARLEYFSHSGPQGRGQEFWIENAQYSFQSSGENLARYFHDPKEAVDAWMASPAHRVIILDPSYQHLGIGISRDNSGNYYSAAHFAKPSIFEAFKNASTPGVFASGF